MNLWLFCAGILLALVGIVHSVLGERLIFRRLRGKGIVPTGGGSHLREPHLREPHLRILWATWHLASVSGWAAAFVLLYASHAAVPKPVTDALMASAAASAIVVLAATRGRHPGWIALSVVALLVWCAPESAAAAPRQGASPSHYKLSYNRWRIVNT